jgi:hypothetical protein
MEYHHLKYMEINGVDEVIPIRKLKLIEAKE